MRHLIIGNGAAGVAAAEKLRHLDPWSEIRILSAEPYPVYSKYLLPEFISGKLDEERLFLRERDFYLKNNIQTHFGFEVTRIDTVRRFVETVDGKTWTYDKLLIASGSRAITPSIVGINEASRASRILALNSLDDAKKIKAVLKHVDQIAMVGAGFVGLGLAFGLAKIGKKVTLIERCSRILPSQLDDTAVNVMMDELAGAGIRVLTDAALVAAESGSGDSSGLQLILENGSRIECELVVMTTGSQPGFAFADHQVAMNRGIIVDLFMTTSTPDVFAAGDVAEIVDAVSGRRMTSLIWPNAVLQGEIAACNMAGFSREFPNQVSMRNASEFREIPLISMGTVEPDGPGYEEFLEYRPKDRVYRKLVVKNNMVVGMIYMGDLRNSGVIANLIRRGINVSREKVNMLHTNFINLETGAVKVG